MGVLQACGAVSCGALIHNASRGRPRAVNNLGLHALTVADHAVVDEKAARIAIAETAAG